MDIITLASYRKKPYFIHPGRLLKINQANYQAGLIRGLRLIERVTRTRFIRQTKPRGFQFYTVNTAQMLQLYKKGGVPLALAWKNKVYMLNDADRFRVPQTLEAVTAHEVGHLYRIGHNPDRTSIMNANLTSRTMNAADIAIFQKRCGKPFKVKQVLLDAGFREEEVDVLIDLVSLI